ncbi:hypothetical protein ACHAXR_004709, partial [Thalassiosira sp. AJA248-18]
RINHRDQIAYKVRIPDIDDQSEFWICCSNFKVTTAAAEPFEDERPAPRVAAAQRATGATNDLRGTFENVQNNIGRGATAEDIQALRDQGITVDNEDAAPENTVAPTAAETAAQVGEWFTPNTCPRKADGNIRDMEGGWNNFRWSQIAGMSELDLFRMCFPEEYIRDTIIPETNKNINGENIDLQEFYVWLGCHFFMACFEGISDRRDWWSTKPVSMFEGAPFRLNEYMSLTRFKNICSAMRYTDEELPSFLDRFHDVRKILIAFNDHYGMNYSPSWMNTLDESMNSWPDKHCPGFMCVPRKPHPFGNEYHSIADGDQGRPIMWRIKLQEGKDRPKKADGTWAFPSEFEQQHSKTAVLMLEMTKPIHNSGRVVTMDSGFCVTVGILAQHNYGVYGQALIKKRGRYWPRGVPGDQIDTYFADKQIGYTETLRQVIDGQQFLIHCTKEEKYVTKLMSTHGLINEVADHPTYRQVQGQWMSYKYTEPISRHRKAAHWVDDVNNRRHDPIGLEDVWGTKWWPDRQFTFLCSVAEANACNSRARGRKLPAEPQLTFRRQLAKGMLENQLDGDGNCPNSPVRLRRRARPSLDQQHQLLTRKTFTGSWNSEARTWATVKTAYLKTQCKTCKFECRTYCSCKKEVTMCYKCWGEHKPCRDITY